MVDARVKGSGERERNMGKNFEYLIAEHELTLLNEEGENFEQKAQDGGILYLLTTRSFQSLNYTACIMWDIIRENCFFLSAKEAICQFFHREDDAEIEEDLRSFFDFLFEAGAIKMA